MTSSQNFIYRCFIDGSGLVKNLVHTHYSKDNDSKLLNPQDLYLRFAKVTSYPSIGLLQTVGMQSSFGTVNTIKKKFSICLG